jgi:hypothetical protein
MSSGNVDQQSTGEKPRKSNPTSNTPPISCSGQTNTNADTTQVNFNYVEDNGIVATNSGDGHQ